MYAVEMSHVTVSYGSHIALDDISFRIEEGTFLAIMGPNGAGKTTLLKTILGMAPLIRGNVRVLGYDAYKDSIKVRNLIGYVPQKESIDATIPVLVKDVVLMGRFSHIGLFRKPSKLDYNKAQEALRLVGLEDLWDEPFVHLSGGQQQRVLIARALARDPKILLLDEPFAQVDFPSQESIARLLYELKEEGITIIIVIHDIDIVLKYIDQIMLLNKKLIAFGTPNEILKSEILSRAYKYGLMYVPSRGVSI